MESEAFKWGGFSLCFLGVFLLSLFHIALATSSRIALSRYLEDKEKSYRQKIMDIFDELKIAVESMRSFFIIAFLVFLFVAFPRLQLWPLWMFLVALGIFLVFFEFLPRLLIIFFKKVLS